MFARRVTNVDRPGDRVPICIQRSHPRLASSATRGGMGTAEPRLTAAWFGLLLVAATLWGVGLRPARCFAEEDAPSIVGFGLAGIGTGAATGLAVGYITTGTHFNSDEWRPLLWGTGIGALTGLGVGILLGTVDAAMGRQRGVGFYMIRDSNYGVTVGFLAGGIVGAMVWLGGGDGRDLLRGMAWGTVIGAGSGLLIGVLEGVLRGSPPPAAEASRVHLGIGFAATTRGAPIPYPSLTGRF